MPIQYTTEVIARFLSHVSTSPTATGCLEWTGYRNKKGYGQAQVNGKVSTTNRISWEIANGPIPAGLHVLHHCDNPACCNPDHLFLGTNADNIADKVAKDRNQRMRGSTNGYAILDENDVLQILSLHRAGIRQTTMARQFHVSKHAINKIVKRKNWSWLSVPSDESAGW